VEYAAALAPDASLQVKALTLDERFLCFHVPHKNLSEAMFSFYKKKTFIPSHRIFGHMHGALNVDKKIIAQFA
jgi:hypothetical protein